MKIVKRVAKPNIDLKQHLYALPFGTLRISKPLICIKKNNRIENLDDLFSMFYDFEIVGLRIDDQILTMEILVPLGEMWNMEKYKMTFRFEGCRELKCHYWVRTSNELIKDENGLHYPCEERVTNDPSKIVNLQLDIQSHKFIKPDIFVLHCDSLGVKEIGQIEFGRIEMTTTGYQIFDNEMNEITLDKMKVWATEWWDGIKKMWDDHRAKN